MAEVDVSTDSIVKVLSGKAYQFEYPGAMALSGPDLFVSSPEGGYHDLGSVTELDISTGAVVRLLSGPAYQFYNPGAMAVSGHDLFVTSYGSTPTDKVKNLGSVTEVDISSGAVVRSLPARDTTLPTRTPRQ